MNKVKIFVFTAKAVDFLSCLVYCFLRFKDSLGKIFCTIYHARKSNTKDEKNDNQTMQFNFILRKFNT